MFFTVLIALVFGSVITVPYILYHLIIQYDFMQDIYEESFRVMLLSLFIGVFGGGVMPFFLEK